MPKAMLLTVSSSFVINLILVICKPHAMYYVKTLRVYKATWLARD
jgi:hypothetical protein